MYDTFPMKVLLTAILGIINTYKKDGGGSPFMSKNESEVKVENGLAYRGKCSHINDECGRIFNLLRCPQHIFEKIHKTCVSIIELSLEAFLPIFFESM